MRSQSPHSSRKERGENVLPRFSRASRVPAPS